MFTTVASHAVGYDGGVVGTIPAESTNLVIKTHFCFSCRYHIRSNMRSLALCRSQT